jgi:hypothetical protein
MHKEYKEMLTEIGNYIFHLEETILSYEEKLKDMELDDMVEHQKKYPGKSKYYYNRQEQDKHQTKEEWAYSKTEGDDDEARREALAKSQARAEIELKKLDSLE